MTGSAAPDIAESAATGQVARLYAQVRRSLGSSHVPTFYRVLAPHLRVLDRAVLDLTAVVALAEATGVAHAMREVARPARPDSPESTARTAVVPLSANGCAILDRYRTANPLNLLVCLALLGTARPRWPGVMQPPLPSPGPAPWTLLDDVRNCHGGVVTPGLWVELANLPEDAIALWRWVREEARGGGIPVAATRVGLLAARALEAAGYGASGSDALRELPSQTRQLLAWFPTGISTMIVEGEWMGTATDTHEETRS
jgi:hypothetical protein